MGGPEQHISLNMHLKTLLELADAAPRGGAHTPARPLITRAHTRATALHPNIATRARFVLLCLRAAVILSRFAFCSTVGTERVYHWRFSST